VSEEQPKPVRNPGVYAGRPLGIPLYIAPSWFIIAGLLTVSLADYLDQRSGVSSGTAYIAGAVFVVLLYFSVLVHELSHSWIAKTLGLPVRRIVLLLIGGVSELEREPETAAREYLVALAGPVMSLFLAGVGFAIADVFKTDSLPQIVAAEVALANGLVAVFNLLPGLPLDGGRVLRAVVWRLTHNPLRGTVAAAWTGRIIGLLIGAVPIVLYGVLPENDRPNVFNVLWFVVISSFLWAGASQALRIAAIRERLPQLSARALARRALTVPYDLPLAEAMRQAHDAGARGLVTVDGDGRPSGIVSEAAVIATPEHRRPWVAVGTLARRMEPSLVVDADLVGQAVLDAIGRAPASEYVVVDGATGAIWGVLATADVVTVVNR